MRARTGCMDPYRTKSSAFTERARDRVMYLISPASVWIGCWSNSSRWKRRRQVLRGAGASLEFECELCTWAIKQAAVAVGDVEWATDVDTDEDEEQHSPTRWSLQTVSSVL